MSKNRFSVREYVFQRLQELQEPRTKKLLGIGGLAAIMNYLWLSGLGADVWGFVSLILVVGSVLFLQAWPMFIYLFLIVIQMFDPGLQILFYGWDTRWMSYRLRFANSLEAYALIPTTLVLVTAVFRLLSTLKEAIPSRWNGLPRHYEGTEASLTIAWKHQPVEEDLACFFPVLICLVGAGVLAGTIWGTGMLILPMINYDVALIYLVLCLLGGLLLFSVMYRAMQRLKQGQPDKRQAEQLFRDILWQDMGLEWRRMYRLKKKQSLQGMTDDT